MTDRIRIGVLFGGRSGEHEVSLLSARSVLSVLSPEKFIVTPIGINHAGTWLVGENALDALSAGQEKSLTPATLIPEPGNRWLYTIHTSENGVELRPYAELDIIFPVLHGSFGEDGTLQGLLDMADMAYVGSGVLGSSVGMDKALFKDVMRTNHVPVLDSIVVTRHEILQDIQRVIEKAERVAPYPLFTKPANLGSSVGVSKCRGRSDLLEGLMEAARFDRRILIEKGLNNPREIEVSVLGNDQPKASVPGEVVPADDFYTYNAKYLDDRSKLIIPAELPAEITYQIQEIAENTFKAVDCAGLARVDFLLDRETNAMYVSEINTIPGFTRISMYPKLWEASGLPYGALVERLVDLAMERKAERDQLERYYGRNQ